MKNDRDGLHLNRRWLLESRGGDVALEVLIKLVLFGESIKGFEGVRDIGSVDFDLEVAAEQRELLLGFKADRLFLFLLLLLLIVAAIFTVATVL